MYTADQDCWNFLLYWTRGPRRRHPQWHTLSSLAFCGFEFLIEFETERIAIVWQVTNLQTEGGFIGFCIWYTASAMNFQQKTLVIPSKACETKDSIALHAPTNEWLFPAPPPPLPPENYMGRAKINANHRSSTALLYFMVVLCCGRGIIIVSRFK